MENITERDYAYFSTVRGMCRRCRAVVPARVFFRHGKVWQESLCPTCGGSPALIASDRDWYLENTLKVFPDRSPMSGASPPRRGCPHDCGPCTWHASACQLPVFSITNACNLRCPICFTYNRRDRLYFMSGEELNQTLDRVIKTSGPVDLINITGGEPTLHPGLIELLRACRRPEIGRITMNTNGLKLAEDDDLCRQLADLGVCVVLSFNTFDPKVSVTLHGRSVVDEKLRAIENLSRAGVRMTLLNVMARGVNDQAAGELIGLMMKNDLILSIVVQTMAYTGQGGGNFPDRRHLPVDEATGMICRASQGALEPGDFMPRPSAHPLCYAVSYLLKSGDTLLPFARVAPREKLSALMKDSYLMRLDGDDSFFREIIDDLYARGRDEHLAVFRDLIDQLYPSRNPPDGFARQRVAESAVRSVYVHAHMDEDTFDCSRAMMCPDQVPAEPGRMVPACTYNLFYRRLDERFYDTKIPESGGAGE